MTVIRDPSLGAEGEPELNPNGDRGDSLTSRTLSGGGFLTMAAIVQVIMQFVVVGILARVLMPSDFGTVAAASVLIELATAMSHLGMDAAIVQRLDVTHAHIRVAFTVSVLNSAVVTLVLYLLAGPVAHALNTPSAEPLLKALSFVFVIRSFGVVAEGLAVRDMKFKLLAVRRTLGYFIGYGCVGVSAALLGWGPWALVAAKLGETVTTAILLILSSRHSMIPLIRRQEMKDLTSFGTGYVVGQVANTLATQADVAVVARMMGPASLGFYSRSYQIMRLPSLLLGNIVDDVAFPSLATIQNDRTRLARGLYRGLLMMNLLLFMIAVLCAVLAPEIIGIALGPKWTAAAAMLALFAIALPFRSTQRLASTASRAVGDTWGIAIRQIAYFLLVTICALIGAHYSLHMVVIGVTVAIFIQFGMQIQLAARLTGMSGKMILMAHVRAVPATILAAVPALLVANAMRAIEAGPVPTLIVTSLAAGIMVVIGARIAPLLVLTPDGLDLVGAVAKKMPEPVGRFMSKAMGIE